MSQVYCSTIGCKRTAHGLSGKDGRPFCSICYAAYGAGQYAGDRTPASPVLTEEQEREAGLYLAEVLGLKPLTTRTAPSPSDAGRYLLGGGYGTKTPLGLYRTVADIVRQVQSGQSLPR